jgi:glutamyl-tRNA reductase
MIIANRNVERAREVATRVSRLRDRSWRPRDASARSRRGDHLDREPDRARDPVDDAGGVAGTRVDARCSCSTSPCRATSSPAIAELEDVYLFTIDDLQGVVDRNLEGRRAAARVADQLIATEVDRFELGLRTRDAAPAIRRLRDDAEAIRQQTIEQAERMLASGRDRAR